MRAVATSRRLLVSPLSTGTQIQRMNDKYDPIQFEISFRSNTLVTLRLVPPEFAELLETNTLQLLIKLARYKFAARLMKPQYTVLEKVPEMVL